MTEANMAVPLGNRAFSTTNCSTSTNNRSTREALACWARTEFRSQKELARTFDLTVVQARSVFEGAATGSTIDLIWRHPNGGPRVAVTVLRAVMGGALDQFIQTELEEIAHAQRRVEERRSNAKALWARAFAAGPRADGGAGLGDPEPRGNWRRGRISS
jgi:hypothetical protein